jgi:hypothetical protein
VGQVTVHNGLQAGASDDVVAFHGLGGVDPLCQVEQTGVTPQPSEDRRVQM